MENEIHYRVHTQKPAASVLLHTITENTCSMGLLGVGVYVFDHN